MTLVNYDAPVFVLDTVQNVILFIMTYNYWRQMALYIYIFVGIGLEKALLPAWHKTITWTNASSWKNMSQMSSAKLMVATLFRPQCVSNSNCRGLFYHYDDVIMTMLASQITSLTVVYSIVHSCVNQRKHQSSASLAFVREIHRDRWISRTNGQLRGKCFHLMTSSC